MAFSSHPNKGGNDQVTAEEVEQEVTLLVVRAAKEAWVLAEEEAGFTCPMVDDLLSSDELLGMAGRCLTPSLSQYILTIRRPEDIFGSLEVDANGSFVGGNGNYQPSG